MAEADSPGGGLLSSVRRMSSSLVALIHTRIELFAVELQEEKIRAISVIGWLIAALALAVAGILLGIGILGLFLWQRAGYLGLIALLIATLGSSVALLWLLRRRILRGPDPFSATIAEIGKRPRMPAPSPIEELSARKQLLVRQAELYREILAMERLGIHESIEAAQQKLQSSRWWLAAGMACMGWMIAGRSGGVARWLPTVLAVVRVAQKLRR